MSLTLSTAASEWRGTFTVAAEAAIKDMLTEGPFDAVFVTDNEELIATTYAADHDPSRTRARLQGVILAFHEDKFWFRPKGENADLIVPISSLTSFTC